VKYDELPELGELGMRRSWEELDPSLGTLSSRDPSDVVAAAALVRTGEVLPLNLDVAAFDPPLFGRPAAAHSVFEAGRNTFEDVLDSFNPQASSQWDGLGHVRAREHGFFGGLTDAEQVGDRLGMQHWARRGIVGRGVLLDVARHRASAGRALDPFSGEPIYPDELADVADAQAVALRQGDILCVRTGWVGEFRRRTAAGAEVTRDRWAGLAAGEPTARYLWDSGVAAVAMDNPAIERGPGDPRDGSLHRRLIPALGFALAELLDLDPLAQACAREGRATFLFVAVPLPVCGAVSSPSNAVAIL
jgi:kynurenine formamidase